VNREGILASVERSKVVGNEPVVDPGWIAVQDERRSWSRPATVRPTRIFSMRSMCSGTWRPRAASSPRPTNRARGMSANELSVNGRTKSESPIARATARAATRCAGAPACSVAAILLPRTEPGCALTSARGFLLRSATDSVSFTSQPNYRAWSEKLKRQNLPAPRAAITSLASVDFHFPPCLYGVDT